MALSAEDVAVELEVVRRRSLGLLDPLSEDDQRAQHSPLMSPLVWDLAHVGNYEDLWLLRAIDRGRGGRPHLDDLYDAFRHPRAGRPALPLLGPAEARAYIAEVRDRALDVLEGVELDGDAGSPLLRDGFVYGMAIQHEHQHAETMLATRQLMGERATPPGGVTAVRRATVSVDAGAEAFVTGGEFVMGTDVEPWAYDNERPAHPVTLAPFFIDVAPVTNDAFRQFVEDGGYDTPALWDETGWKWRLEADLRSPEFWRTDDWTVLRFGARVPLDWAEPVQHVCWYEADAFARWAGKRLPAEAEWEWAASWDAEAGRKRRYPWGDAPPTDSQANLGQRHTGPAPVGAYPDGVSAVGCHQLLGDVWEWTASDFSPYPGFASFPYREYSEVFFGSAYKVLRGASWATHPHATRNTFRNWDYPIRRQIFAGFRCARDA